MLDCASVPNDLPGNCKKQNKKTPQQQQKAPVISEPFKSLDTMTDKTKMSTGTS